MGIISVLIADDNVEYCNALYKCLIKQKDIRVAGIAKDGFETVEMIKTLLPDIVILDIVMPGLDGIGVMEKLQKEFLYYRPIIVVASAISLDSVIRRTMDLDAQYFFIKPYDMETMAPRLRQLYFERFSFSFNDSQYKVGNYEISEFEIISEKEIDTVIGKLLKQFGILPYTSGYHYLREAVHIILKNKISDDKIDNTIYSAIAGKFATTPKKVERSMRGVVEKVLAKQEYSGLRLEKPVIYRFISQLAGKARIEIKQLKMK